MGVYEIPTHLDVEDKVMYGLTARQVAVLLSGASLGYYVWTQLLWTPLLSRLALAGLLLVMTVALAFLRPGGRGMEEWLFVIVHYTATPRIATWRPASSLEPPVSDLPGWTSWQYPTWCSALSVEEVGG